MKKLIMALMCGILLAPITAMGQTWIEPYTKSDGTVVEGHWQTPEDVREKGYSTPGKINPYTGKYNPYTGSYTTPQPVNPPPTRFDPASPQDFRPNYKPNYKVR